MRFNEKLRLLREAKGITQAQLAERTHLSRAAISLYESGARRVAFDDAPMLADALGVDKTVFDQDELWAEYEAALAQAKQILLGHGKSARDSHADPASDSQPSAAHVAGTDESSTRDFCAQVATPLRKVLARTPVLTH